MSAFRQWELTPRNAKMEDVPKVYQRPHDPARPAICLDETSKQLVVETRCRSRRRQANPPGSITNMNAMARRTCS